MACTKRHTCKCKAHRYISYNTFTLSGIRICVAGWCRFTNKLKKSGILRLSVDTDFDFFDTFVHGILGPSEYCSFCWNHKLLSCCRVTKTFDTYTGHNINDTIKTMWAMNQSCNKHGQLTKNKEIILKIMGSVNGQYSANNRDTVFGIPIKTALDFPNQWWWNAHYFCYINCGSIYGFIRIFFTYTEIIYKDIRYTLEQGRDSETIRKSIQI